MMHLFNWVKVGSNNLIGFWGCFMHKPSENFEKPVFGCFFLVADLIHVLFWEGYILVMYRLIGIGSIGNFLLIGIGNFIVDLPIPCTDTHYLLMVKKYSSLQLKIFYNLQHFEIFTANSLHHYIIFFSRAQIEWSVKFTLYIKLILELLIVKA